MAPSRSPFSLLPLLALLQLTTAAVVDFSLYPTGAQACLYNAASASQCGTSSVPVFNSCVCSNGGGFIDSAAKCIAANDKGDLNSVYSVMSSNCATSNTPIAYSLSQYLSVAGAGSTATPGTTTVATTVQQVSTITSQGTTLRITTSAVQTTVLSGPSAVVSTLTLGGQAPGESASVTVVTLIPDVTATGSSPSSTSAAAAAPPANKGLSTGAIIGIGAGVGVPLFLALVGLISVLIWRGRRRRDPPPPQSTAYPNTEPSTTGLSPRPMSTVTTLDNYNRYSSQPGLGAAAMPKHDYSPPAQYSQQVPANAYQNMYNGQPMYDAQNSQRPVSQAYAPNAYPPPQPGHVEIGGSPAVRPQELPANQGYHY
jgi:hypothetical protein